MKKVFCTITVILLLALCFPSKLNAQDFGVSFSYFFPKNGKFSVPVAPLSVRGFGIKFGNHFSLSTGISLYRVGAWGVKGVPYDNVNSIMGPSLPLMMPLVGKIIIPIDKVEVGLKGGIFGFYNFAQEVNTGQLDRAIKEHESYALVNGKYSSNSNFGGGYHFGTDVVIHVTKKWGLKLGGNYYIGGSDINLKGEYTGYKDGDLETGTVDLPDSQLDFSGFEVSLGAVF